MRNTTDTRTARLIFALSLALALAFVFTLAATFVPGRLGGSGVGWALENEAREVEEPGVAAGAGALTDLHSGELLAGEDASARLPMASTTKIMAAW